jgi:hypothetical protein
MASGRNVPIDDSDVRRLLGEVSASVRWLQDELTDLRALLATELRTRRVVVVDEAGFERIVLAAHEKYGHVTVFAAAPGRASTCVELFVTDRVDEDGAEVGVALVDAGDTVATLNAFTGRRARLWVDDGPSRAPIEP